MIGLVGLILLLRTNKIARFCDAEWWRCTKKAGANTVLQNLDLTSASILIITGELELLRSLLERKEALTEAILLAGAGFQTQVELLITIRGMPPRI